jgi:GxxExxY protein
MFGSIGGHMGNDRESVRRLDELSHEIIGAGIEVHRTLGPGLLESVYETCLEAELTRRGISCRRQVTLPVTYRGLLIAEAFRLDLLVADAIVVEIKAVESIKPVHRAQLLTYLRLTGHCLGLLMNFQEKTLSNGIRRLVNGFPGSAAA